VRECGAGREGENRGRQKMRRRAVVKGKKIRRRALVAERTGKIKGTTSTAKGVSSSFRWYWRARAVQCTMQRTTRAMHNAIYI
jgi:hypothetical protein